MGLKLSLSLTNGVGMLRKIIVITISAVILGVANLFPGVASADVMPVVEVYGTILNDQTWTNDNVYQVGSATIPDGVTVTIEPGTIVKYTMSWGFAAIEVDSGGVLNATGTTALPIIFTSYKDDSYGGDTNGDGTSVGALGDYPAAIGTSPYYPDAEVTVSNAKFLYGTQSMSVNCNYSTETSVTISDSEIHSQFKASGCPKDTYQLARNQFQLDPSDTYVATELVSSDPSGIILNGVDTNTYNGTGKARAIWLGSGNSSNPLLSIGSSWIVEEASNAVLDVNNMGISGVMTIGAGVIVKGNTSQNALYVKDGGSLTVAGTMSDPVIFTSIKNDAAGGDTNGDGYSVGAADDYNGAIQVEGGNNNVNISYGKFEYGTYSLSVACNYASNNDIVVVDSTIDSTANVIGCAQNTVNFARNQFNVSSPSQSGAIYFGDTDPSGLNLSGADQNIFNGTGKSSEVSILTSGPQQNLINSGASWTVSGGGGAVLHIHELFVEGSLTIEPGATVKIDDYGNGLRLKSGGSIVANGSVGSPVIFTSYKDDSVGGDTNGDGNSSIAGSIDYSSAILVGDTVDGGEIDINHAELRNAISSMQVVCGNNAPSISIKDSKIKSSARLSYCQDSLVQLKRNEFVLPNDADSHALSLSRSNPSDIVMDGTDQNTFTGTGKSRVVAIDGDGITNQLPSGADWTVSGTTNGVLLPNNFHIGGTLNLENGAVVKSGQNHSGIRVKEGGVLNIAGAANSKVIFTSAIDDSIGGDTNNDGANTTPSANDYPMAIDLAEGAELNADHLIVKYGARALMASGAEATITHADIANMSWFAFVSNSQALFTDVSVENTSEEGALHVSGDSAVVFRGSFEGITGKAIRSCSWSSDGCSVDAAYTDWGRVDGPNDISNSTPMVCGMVSVSPWMYDLVQYDGDELFSTPNCDGGGSPIDQSLSSNVTYFGQRVGAAQSTCQSLGDEICQVVQNAYQCLTGAVDLATSVYPIPIPSVGNTFDPTAGDVIANNARTYVVNQASQQIFGLKTRNGIGLNTAWNVMSAMNSAYGSCAP